MAKKREIRNNNAEFLTFIASLFDCSTDNIGLHLKNILKSGELIEDSVSEKISATAAVGDVMLPPPIAYP